MCNGLPRKGLSHIMRFSDEVLEGPNISLLYQHVREAPDRDIGGRRWLLAPNGRVMVASWIGLNRRGVEIAIFVIGFSLLMLLLIIALSIFTPPLHHISLLLPTIVLLDFVIRCISPPHPNPTRPLSTGNKHQSGLVPLLQLCLSHPTLSCNSFVLLF